MLLYVSNSAREATSTPLHSVSVAGAVVREDGGRLPVIRRTDNGTWELPGGVLELTEAPEEGVACEVWEETGIRGEVEGLTGVCKNTTRGIVTLAFHCKPSGGEKRTSTESPGVEWLAPEEVAARTTEVYAVRLLDTLDDKGPHVRHLLEKSA
ncbi:NUDIX hydrolase [Streptomyces cinereoruber]|uniref:NUDIX hydrolase n=1 Tax=Streptomyces cinereoruber TaxID=67260 RepID=UPI003C2CBC11